MKIQITEVHERNYRRLFGRHELQRLLVEAIARELDIPVSDLETAKVEVDYEDETEGSPSYKVGTRARVHITRKLSP